MYVCTIELTCHYTNFDVKSSRAHMLALGPNTTDLVFRSATFVGTVSIKPQSQLHALPILS